MHYLGSRFDLEVAEGAPVFTLTLVEQGPVKLYVAWDAQRVPLTGEGVAVSVNSTAEVAGDF